MENVRLAKLSPVIQAQKAKIQGMRQVIEAEHARNRQKMEQYAKQAQEQAAQRRSLKHDFTVDAYSDPAPGSAFVDVVAYVKDNQTGKEVYRLPTRCAMEMGREARRRNVERILDFLV